MHYYNFIFIFIFQYIFFLSITSSRKEKNNMGTESYCPRSQNMPIRNRKPADIFYNINFQNSVFFHQSYAEFQSFAAEKINHNCNL